MLSPQTELPLLLLGLCVVLLAAWTQWRRSSRLGVGSGMRVLARLQLEPRRAVYVVQIAERVLVLGSSESGLASLGDLEPEQAAQLVADAASTRRTNPEGWWNRFRASAFGARRV